MDSETTKAYLAGLKLKNSGLSEEVIYARIEKQGFSEELARRVARDVMKENEHDQLKENIIYGLGIALVGIAGTAISFFLFDDRIYIFPGLLIAGIGALLLYLDKGKSKRK